MTAIKIHPREAQERMQQGWHYVDVRSIPEFEAGHPSGAYNIPLLHAGDAGMEPNADFLRVVRASFPLDARLILGCRSGARSANAASMLMSAGYTEVVDQTGGFLGRPDPFGRPGEAGWSQQQLPVATQSEVGRSYEELLSKAKTEK